MTTGIKPLIVSLLLISLLSSSPAATGPARPRILGVAHMALFVSDLEKSRDFYERFLGFEEPYVLKLEDGSVRIAFIKVNDYQYLELFVGRPTQDGHLNHIALLTDSAEGMRAYLASRGVKVPDKVSKGRIGNLNFNLTDPDDHTVEIVEYQPDGWTTRERGRFMPDTRISSHIAHLGILVGALDPALKFYGDVLGFREFWRGSSNDKVLSWVNVRVPDADDYLEFMLYSGKQDAAQMGVKNHICLITPDIIKAVAILEARPARKQYSRPIEIKVGKNGKRQANLFDPDGTRIELMEPNTFDGKAVPSSTAPPPG